MTAYTVLYMYMYMYMYNVQHITLSSLVQAVCGTVYIFLFFWINVFSPPLSLSLFFFSLSLFFFFLSLSFFSFSLFFLLSLSLCLFISLDYCTLYRPIYFFPQDLYFSILSFSRFPRDCRKCAVHITGTCTCTCNFFTVYTQSRPCAMDQELVNITKGHVTNEALSWPDSTSSNPNQVSQIKIGKRANLNAILFREKRERENDSRLCVIMISWLWLWNALHRDIYI